MKKMKLLAMSLLVAGSFMAQANADIVGYSETFIGDTVENVDGGALEFGNASTTVTAGLWSVGQNQVTIDATGTGTLVFTGNNNFRGAGAFIDLAGTAAGTYQMSFDLSAYDFTTTATNASTEAYVWEVSGVTVAAGGGVSIDLGSGAGGGFQGITPTGTGSMAAQIASVAFSGSGITTVDFTLSTAGVAGDFLGIVLGKDGGSSAATGLSSGGYVVDTISVAAVPEPSSLMLFGMTTLGLVVRRRRKS